MFFQYTLVRSNCLVLTMPRHDLCTISNAVFCNVFGSTMRLLRRIIPSFSQSSGAIFSYCLQSFHFPDTNAYFIRCISSSFLDSERIVSRDIACGTALTVIKFKCLLVFSLSFGCELVMRLRKSAIFLFPCLYVTLNRYP